MSDSDPFARVRGLYRDQFIAHGDTPAGVFWPKGRQELRFAALTSAIGEEPFHLLDFGCGLGHLLPWLREHYPAGTYTGVDIVPEYIRHAQEAFPSGDFRLIESIADLADDFDYTVLSGVFNLRYTDAPAEHEALVYDILEALFARTRRALAVNFQSPYVDFEQPDAHHQNIDRLLGFCVDRLSRRFSIDHATLPYEFTLLVRVDDEIERPQNTYANAL